MRNNKGQIGLVISGILVICIFLALILISAIGIHVKTMENGTHKGYITAIETNGLIWKTDSVYFKTDAQSSQEDRYCVIDKKIKAKLLSYQESKTLVTIEYMDYFSKGWKYCKISDDAGIITDVKP